MMIKIVSPSLSCYSFALLLLLSQHFALFIACDHLSIISISGVHVFKILRFSSPLFQIKNPFSSFFRLTIKKTGIRRREGEKERRERERE
jgi:hypothetical protein